MLHCRSLEFWVHTKSVEDPEPLNVILSNKVCSKGKKEAGLFIPFTVLTIDSGGNFDACVVCVPPSFQCQY